MDVPDARLRATGGSLQQNRVVQEMVTRSLELRREARLDGIRRRRLRMRNSADT